MLSRRGYIVPPHVAHETQQQFDAMYTRKKVEEELTTEQLVSDDSAATGLFTNVLPDYTSTQPSVARSPPKTDLNAPLCDETSAPLNYSETPLNVGVGSENVNVLDFTVQLAQNTSQTLMVFFPCDTDKNNIGIAPIRNYLTVMDTHNCKHAILVVYENLTSPAVLMLKDLEAKGIFVSFFAERFKDRDIFPQSPTIPPPCCSRSSMEVPSWSPMEASVGRSGSFSMEALLWGVMMEKVEGIIREMLTKKWDACNPPIVYED